jgi:signal transduction histidine kinase
VDCLDEVLRQALLNSMVHGGAMSVTVQISGASGTDIAVKITDDGVGPRGGPPGLGTKSLNSVTAGNWALEPAPAGTGAVLTATIPRA